VPSRICRSGNYGFERTPLIAAPEEMVAKKKWWPERNGGQKEMVEERPFRAAL